jgi:hypothetical protein
MRAVEVKYLGMQPVSFWAGFTLSYNIFPAYFQILDLLLSPL